MVRLSVLDQSPVPEGSTAGAALRNSIDLARHADRLGYHRYWVAEHHNMEGLAGSSPEILVGHIADNTDRIRVGSGGVMLSHYSPLKVAENFRVLEALHPGRVDLGLGRAPGSDHRTAAALARGGQPLSVEYYPTMVRELRQLLHDRVPDDGPMSGIQARPLTHEAPEMWLLASSQDSAAIAAHLGLPLSWAHFINPDGAAICQAYTEQYSPSYACENPRVSIGISVLCAQDAGEAERLATSIRTWRGRGLQGQIPFPTDEHVGEDPFAGASEYQRRKPLIVGEPPTVKAEIEELVGAYGAEEVVIVSICHDHAARVRSYELIADAFGLV
ncbi:MAG: LLM class flavin-dependent oxidoreductase [Acidimicrobiales bacterium]